MGPRHGDGVFSTRRVSTGLRLHSGRNVALLRGVKCLQLLQASVDAPVVGALAGAADVLKAGGCGLRRPV